METNWANQFTRRKSFCHMLKEESFKLVLGLSMVCQQVSFLEKEKLENILKMVIHSYYILSEERMQALLSLEWPKNNKDLEIDSINLSRDRTNRIWFTTNTEVKSRCPLSLKIHSLRLKLIRVLLPTLSGSPINKKKQSSKNKSIMKKIKTQNLVVWMQAFLDVSQRDMPQM